MTASLSRRRFLINSGAVAATLGYAGPLATPALAQAYPSQDLRWIIYQSPGGLIDTSTRVAQPYLEKQGFKSTIDYVRGASGRIARGQLSRAKSDGHTVMTEASPEEVLGKVVFNADYKLEEFQPVFGWFINAFNLYVPKTSAIKTFEDFVKTARSRRVTVASLGKGGPSHLQLVLLRSKLNLNLQIVHFDGGAPAYSAVAGGHVEAGIGGSTTAQWSETLTFLTVFRNEKDPAFANVPTIRDLNHDIMPVNEVIYANAGPGVPQDRLKKLQDAFEKAFADPTHIEQQKKINVFVKPMRSDEVKKLVQSAFDVATENKAALAE
jgi:tripartite-type tricarboxylate transporter receptor subunit TctC